MKPTDPNLPDTCQRIAVYGNWPHPKGLQCFDRKAAQALCENFRSLQGRFRRAFAGLPVYLGHPDDSRSKAAKQSEPLGKITELEAREDGCYAIIQWDAKRIQNAMTCEPLAFSPRWAMASLVPGSYRPVRLLSVGLTRQPNIPGSPLRIGNPSTSAILAALGLGHTDTELLSKCRDLNRDARQWRETAPRLDQRLKTTEARLQLARRSNDDLSQSLSAQEAAFAAERSARIDALVELAVLKGAITPAEQAQWRTGLSTDFEHGYKELQQRPTELKTQPVAVVEHANGPSSNTQFLNAVLHESEQTGEPFPAVWSRLKRQRRDLYNTLDAS